MSLAFDKVIPVVLSNISNSIFSNKKKVTFFLSENSISTIVDKFLIKQNNIIFLRLIDELPDRVIVAIPGDVINASIIQEVHKNEVEPWCYRAMKLSP